MILESQLGSRVVLRITVGSLEEVLLEKKTRGETAPSKWFDYFLPELRFMAGLQLVTRATKDPKRLLQNQLLATPSKAVAILVQERRLAWNGLVVITNCR